MHRHPSHAWLPPNVPGMESWITPQLNLAYLFRKLRVSLMCLAYFLTYYMYVQPDIGRCLFDWCRNQMSVLYPGPTTYREGEMFYLPRQL